MILRWSLLLYLLLFWQMTSVVSSAEHPDKITSLPGQLFTVNYSMYSGYLNAFKDNDAPNWKMFYWLVESKNDPLNDPLLIFFAGGPGCSSFGDSMEECAPFYFNRDGETLYENIYSWNARSNILFIDSPIGTGFSFDASDPDFNEASDDLTARQNYDAITDFFERVHPIYKNRPFFIGGSSYAGVYIPMISLAIIDGINANKFPNKNFQGFAIGNGFLDVQYLNNANVLWNVYHGKISFRDWDYLKEHCSGNNAAKYDVDNYNFHSFLKSENGIDFFSDNTTCGNLISKVIYNRIDLTNFIFYDSCYADKETKLSNKWQRPKRSPQMDQSSKAVNTADTINYDSTDNQWGYPCYRLDAATKWINREDVQEALHIDPIWQKNGTKRRSYEVCSGALYNSYKNQYQSMDKFFDKIIENVQNPNFRMLIYNGDIDTVCNYLGDAKFMRKIALKHNFVEEEERRPWLFRQETAGFNQRYTRLNMVIDVTTVKGAGHFVPNDRPGPSVQMITNFMSSNDFPDYSSTEKLYPRPTPIPLNRVDDPTESTKSSPASRFLIVIVATLFAVLFS